jgi:pimeloyl-ACP methyl ester carboxylesterase
MKRAPATGTDVAATPRVRRGYFESRFGQLHVHNAMPPGGGFDEATALLCLHGSTGCARLFHKFLEVMGRDRSTYAPDLPGFCESDAPPPSAGIAEYAVGIADFLDSMRFRQIDLLGVQMGAAVAAELSIARPQIVRRVVMIGVPLFTDPEREAVRRSAAAAGEREAGERVSAGPASGTIALAHYSMRERFAHLTQPVLVLRPKGELWDATARVREVLPRVRMIELPAHGDGLLETAPEVVAEAAREFFKS